jgi:hypothetical protein
MFLGKPKRPCSRSKPIPKASPTLIDWSEPFPSRERNTTLGWSVWNDTLSSSKSSETAGTMHQNGEKVAIEPKPVTTKSHIPVRRLTRRNRFTRSGSNRTAEFKYLIHIRLAVPRAELQSDNMVRICPLQSGVQIRETAHLDAFHSIFRLGFVRPGCSFG